MTFPACTPWGGAMVNARLAFAGAKAPDPPPPPASTCHACVTMSKKYQEAIVRNTDLRVEKETLLERITGLQAELNAKAPADREWVELRARLHLLAQQESDQRKRADLIQKDLTDQILTSEALARTVANLHVRLRGLGVTP